MGRLHVRAYSQMPTVKVMGVYDASPETAAAVATEFSVPAIKNLQDLFPQVDAVTIAVPTIFHLPIARQCIEKKIACLIEKPLAKDPAEARQIVDLAKNHNVTVQVGHIERFNPAIRALAKLNIQPRYIETTRISPMTFRSIDVGVVLDMMIHDIDIVLKFANSPVSKIDAVGVSVIGQVEDICNARLTFKNGCVANLTASRMAMKTDRRLRFFSPEAYASIDYQKRSGAVIRRNGNIEAVREAAAKARAGQIQDLSKLNFQDLVHIETLQIEEADSLRAELDAFVEAVNNKTTPIVTAEDGMQAVEVAARIVEAIGPSTLA
jgi:predicted dehydrogenase